MIADKPIDRFDKLNLRVMCPTHGDHVTLKAVDDLTWECPLCQRGTCATCRHQTRSRLPNDEWEVWCAKIGMELDNMPDDFGCSLHQPTEQPSTEA